MALLAAVSGIALIASAMIDAIWTTLTTGGGGPITSRISRGLWRGTLRFQRGGTSERHRMLVFLGTLILLMILITWIVLLWAGWTLLFSVDPTSVLASDTGEPADWVSRTYFTGYTLFTLGIGNFVPRDGFWEIMTALATFNGLTLVTLSITYLLPVLSAVIEKRRLAASVFSLGETPSEIVRRAWTGDHFQGLSNHLAQLTPMIEMHTRQHAAYPVLHYFHSLDRRTAPGPSLAALDEALLLLSEGVHPRVRLSASEILPPREALAGLLRMLEEENFIRQSEEPPEIPDIGVLRDSGIPSVDSEAFASAARSLSDRRRLLRGFVESDGWPWKAVHEPQDEKETTSS